MSPLDIKAGVRRLFRLEVRRPVDAPADGDAEFESLIQEHIAFLVGRGLGVEAARAEAFRRLGPSGAEARGRVRQSAYRRERRMTLFEWAGDAASDCRLAVRSLRRNPGLAAAVILTFALAIAANTAMFSAVDAVLLRPLPFADPSRLVMLWEENPDFGWHQQDAAAANMLDWSEQVAAFQGVAAYESFDNTVSLSGHGEPRSVQTQSVTGNFFDLLGVRPAVGRVFRDAETWAGGGPPVAMLSHRAWREAFGSDSAIVGRSVQMDGRPVEIAGVLPASFRLPGLDPDVWLPVAWPAARRSQVSFRRAHWLKVVARLKPAETAASADAALQVVVARLQRDYPATNTHMGAGLTPLHEFLVGKTRLPLLLMLGGVAILLLIACANIANLLLVRAAAREREGAVRLALGAGRGRLLRQSLVESGVLAGLGAAAGLVLGSWGARALLVLGPAGLLPVKEVTISWSVLGFVAAITGLSAAGFGLAPVLWSARQAPGLVLRDQGRAMTGGRRTRRTGDVLLGAQVALSLALTLGAGLLVRSYLMLQKVGPGFDPSNVLAVRLRPPGTTYDSAFKVFGFYDRLRQEVSRLPGVTAVGITSYVSLGPSSWTSEFAVEGRPPLAPGAQTRHREIAGDYFRAMRVPVIAGRALGDGDRAGAPNVVVINAALARTYFKGDDPIGRRVAFERIPDSTSVWRTIVGVVGDERQASLAQEADPEITAPHQQEPRAAMTLLVRTGGNPASVGPAVRRIVAGIDPTLAIASMRSLEEVRALSLARDRFITLGMVAFAVVGLILGLVGVYGVIAQLARRRVREMGIRLALGAGTRQVQWLIVRHGLTVAGMGVAAGVVIALAGGRAIRTLLFQVAPTDPVAFTVLPAVMLLTAAVASWLPARRASRTDPSEVLRSD